MLVTFDVTLKVMLKLMLQNQTVHLPFQLLGKIVGLQQISSLFVGIGLPCLMVDPLLRETCQGGWFLHHFAA